MRVLICGGRDYNDATLLAATLENLNAEREIELVVHGAARGADTLAQRWADMFGVCCLQFPANWKRDGKAAGPIRNQLMLTEGKPDMVVAFPGGRGTADMVRRAREAGIPVHEVA